MRARIWLLLLALPVSACADHGTFLIDTPLPDTGPDDTGAETGSMDARDVHDAADVAAEDSAHDVAPVDAPDVAADATDVAMADALDATDATDATDAPDALLDVPLPIDVLPDAARDATDAPPVDAGPPWRHTIMIDGVNDFMTGEQFSTTSASYNAYITWDATNLYVGYSGADIAALDMHKWVFVYLDVDPGTGTGASMGQTYNTETPSFPSGFGADYYFRWKTSNDFQTLEQYTGTAWSTVAGVTVRTAIGGTYVEFAIPLSAIGSPASLGIVTLMMNETALHEAAYAGLYAGSFIDGYHAVVPITYWLDANFGAALAPDDPGSRRP